MGWCGTLAEREQYKDSCEYTLSCVWQGARVKDCQERAWGVFWEQVRALFSKLEDNEMPDFSKLEARSIWSRPLRDQNIEGVLWERSEIGLENRVYSTSVELRAL